MIFIDSNILLYLFGDNAVRKLYVLSLFNNSHHISTQVVGENIYVCLRKFKLAKAEAFAHADNLLEGFGIELILPSTIQKATEISIKYGFSYWDSLILASALAAQCTELYSEDMQEGLLVENQVRIVNPFKIQGI